MHNLTLLLTTSVGIRNRESISMNTILTKLRKFNLAGMVKTVELRLSQAQEQSLSHQEFLELLIEDEKTNREDNRRVRLHQRAKLPFVKTLADFDFSFQPSVKKASLIDLSTNAYIPKAENILFIGPPGVGKTHLSVSLGLAALKAGYTVLFTTVWDMITLLQQSRADYTYKQKVEIYAKPDLLILDELGYRTMMETTVEDFFTIIAKRYEKKPTIITSNRDIASWDKIFFDKTLTGAIIDRLLHHCQTFIITGESYRFQNRKKND